MKRFLSFTLAILFIFTMCFMCAACNNDNDPDPGNKTPSTQTPNPNEKDPNEKDPDEKDPDEKDPDEKDPDEKDPDEKDPDEKDPDEKDPDEKDPDEKDPEEEDDGWVSAIFGGGPFVTGGDMGLDVVSSTMKSSGFNTMIIWSVHVREDGTLYLNDDKACENGKVVLGDDTLKMWAGLKEGESSIKRIEISVGAWENKDFDNIRDLINTYGTGSETILYRNFEALIKATGADAVNYDDETCYDEKSAIAFGKMCAEMGVKVALCPYTYANFWAAVKKGLGDIVDRVYLQCYDGGATNTPSTWPIWEQMMGMKLIPGYFGGTDKTKTSASNVYVYLNSGLNSITGGFMWLYDDLQKLPSPNSVSDYARLINAVNPNIKQS